MRFILLIFLVSIISTAYAQQRQSLDDIEMASFKVGNAPFDKTLIPVKTTYNEISSSEEPKDIVLDGFWQLAEGGVRKNG